MFSFLRIILPTSIQRHTVLKSPHIYKKHRAQYEVRTHARLLQVWCICSIIIIVYCLHATWSDNCSQESWPGCSLGIRDQRILHLLPRILHLNFACFLRELCPSIVILPFLFNILLLLRFSMKTLFDIENKIELHGDPDGPNGPLLICCFPLIQRKSWYWTSDWNDLHFLEMQNSFLPKWLCTYWDSLSTRGKEHLWDGL